MTLNASVPFYHVTLYSYTMQTVNVFGMKKKIDFRVKVKQTDSKLCLKFKNKYAIYVRTMRVLQTRRKKNINIHLFLSPKIQFYYRAQF